MNDRLVIVLTVLKFAGAIVSGIAGIIAIAPEKEKRRQPLPKTKAGLIIGRVFNRRWALHCAIIAFAVAILSQFSETLKTRADEKEARRKDQQFNQAIERQISLATDSLQKLNEQGATMQQEMQYLEYMAGKFQKLSVDVVYQIPASDPDFAPLIQRIKDIITPDILSQYQQATNLWSPDGTATSEGDMPEDGVHYSEHTTGYISTSNEVTGELFTLITTDGVIQPSIDDVCEPNWITQVSSDTRLLTFFNFITTPHLKVELFSRRINDITTSRPDFVALSTTQQFSMSFNYDSSKKHITITERPGAVQSFNYNTVTKQTYVTWHFEFPPENWKQTIRMSSIFDLDDAKLVIAFDSITNNSSARRYDFRPTSIKLDFGLVRITVDNLTPLKQKKQKNGEEPNYFCAYTAILPPPNSLKIEDYEFYPLSISSATAQGLKAPNPLVIKAQSGIIDGAFVLTNDYIFQPITTSTTNGGRAIYNFTITNAGNYVILASVNAAGTATNSFYVNVDSQPQDPTMIWDILPTSGFEDRLVSWRGNGTAASDQFVPEVFQLSIGAHQFVVVGRGKNAELRNFTILKLPPLNSYRLSVQPYIRSSSIEIDLP